MDVMDDNGKHDESVSLNDVHKTPLSSSGEIDKSVDPVRVQKGTALVKVGDLSLNETQIETRKANKCGDCYGAHGPLKRYKRKKQKGCCNSCKEIRMAYVHIFVSKKVKFTLLNLKTSKQVRVGGMEVRLLRCSHNTFV